MHADVAGRASLSPSNRFNLNIHTEHIHPAVASDWRPRQARA